MDELCFEQADKGQGLDSIGGRLGKDGNMGWLLFWKGKRVMLVTKPWSHFHCYCVRNVYRPRKVRVLLREAWYRTDNNRMCS